jgi:hypothetical protein
LQGLPKFLTSYTGGVYSVYFSIIVVTYPDFCCPSPNLPCGIHLNVTSSLYTSLVQVKMVCTPDEAFFFLPGVYTILTWINSVYRIRDSKVDSTWYVRQGTTKVLIGNYNNYIKWPQTLTLSRILYLSRQTNFQENFQCII